MASAIKHLFTHLWHAVFTCDKSVAAVFAFSHTLRSEDQQTRAHKSNSSLNTVSSNNNAKTLPSLWGLWGSFWTIINAVFPYIQYLLGSHGFSINSISKLQPQSNCCAHFVCSGQFASVAQEMIHTPKSKRSQVRKSTFLLPLYWACSPEHNSSDI